MKSDTGNKGTTSGSPAKSGNTPNFKSDPSGRAHSTPSPSTPVSPGARQTGITPVAVPVPGAASTAPVTPRPVIQPVDHMATPNPVEYKNSASTMPQTPEPGTVEDPKPVVSGKTPSAEDAVANANMPLHEALKGRTATETPAEREKRQRREQEARNKP